MLRYGIPLGISGTRKDNNPSVNINNQSIRGDNNVVTHNYKPDTVITDEADGASAFANWTIVKGKFGEWYVKPNPEPTDGSKWNCRLAVMVVDVTECLRADGTSPNFSEIELSWPYSTWDGDNMVANPPVKRGIWFKGVVPAWQEAGVTPTIEVLNALENAQALVEFTQQTRPLGYDRKVYVDDVVQLDDDGEEIKEPAMYEDCLPSLIVTAESDPEAPAKRAAELWDDNGGDMAAFKKAAAADDTIKRDAGLRRSIQGGKYEPVTA